MLDIKQFDKTTFDFDGTYNPVLTAICAAVLFVADNYGSDLLNMTGTFAYVLSPVSIIIVLIATVIFLFGVIALNNQKLQIIYAIACAIVSAQILHEFSLVGDYDLLWWGSLIVLSFIWAILFRLIWSHRLIRQSSQCVLGTIAIILLMQPVIQMVVKLFAAAF